MDSVNTHRDLAAWQEAMKLVEVVYHDTASFPKEETYSRVIQTRKSAISVPSNIAEGAARNTSGELVQFLGITCGSLAELETQLELATRLGYLKADAPSISQMNRVGRLVRALRNSLKDRLTN